MFLLLVTLAGCQAKGPAPTVILVVLDTTRADHLSCMGYERGTTPHLDEFAANARLYRNAWAQSPWTLPTFGSILTGHLPRHHGAGMKVGRSILPVRKAIPTMAERLSGEGWTTAAWVNVSFCNPGSGIERGFEVYDYQHGKGSSNTGDRDARATTDAALKWAGDAGNGPLFMLVHYFDPHLTYDAPPPFDTRFEPEGRSLIPRGFGSTQQIFDLRSGQLELGPREKASLLTRYDGEIAFVDSQFQRLRRGLEALGRWENALVIVVGDHGEEFWDHGGFEHGHTHQPELLHVPLIVKRPGEEPGAVDDRVRQIDILPTVLEYAETATDGNLPGTVLGSGSAAVSVAEGSLWGGDLLSLRCDQGLLVRDLDTGEQVWTASADLPDSVQAALVDSLGRILDAIPDAAPGDPAWQPSAEDLEKLRSLGYVN